jgi:hypothetical protein
MAPPIDPELLTPPEVEPLRPWLTVAVLLGVAAMVFGLVVWSPWSGSSPSTAVESAPGSTGSGEEDPVFSETSTGLETVTYQEEFLLYPRLLPHGYRQCWVANDFGDTDRFCDPESEGRWINLTVDRSPLGAGDPVPGFVGAEWAEQGRRILIPMGSASLSITAEGLTPEEILAVARSVPAIGDRNSLYTPPEPPLELDSLTDEQLRGVLGRYGQSVEVTSDAFFFRAWADDVSLIANPVFDQLYGLVSTMPQPRLVNYGRPIIVGESGERGQWWATWIQRGFVFRVQGQGTAPDGESAATEAIDAIEALP